MQRNNFLTNQQNMREAFHRFADKNITKGEKTSRFLLIMALLVFRLLHSFITALSGGAPRDPFGVHGAAGCIRAAPRHTDVYRSAVSICTAVSDR